MNEKFFIQSRFKKQNKESWHILRQSMIEEIIEIYLQLPVCCPSFAMSQTCNLWLLNEQGKLNLLEILQKSNRNQETFNDESENPPATSDPS